MLVSMGNTCCDAIGVCGYQVFASPKNDKERKINAMINSTFFCGSTTPQDIEDTINANFRNGGGYGPLYILVFPPVLEEIYVLNTNTLVGTGVLPENGYIKIPNPYLDQAKAMEGLLFGQAAVGAFPCSQTYTVPFGFASGIASVVYSAITNPNYAVCVNSMYSTLSRPIPSTTICIDGVAANQPVQTYDYNNTKNQIDSSSIQFPRTPPQGTAILQCLTSAQGGTGGPSPTNCANALLVPKTIGPYDTSTGNPCTSVTSPTCTYQICLNNLSKIPWSCTSSGKCLQLIGGSFATQALCEQCQANGTCGPNICCPQSQTGGACPTNPPAPNPTTNFIMLAVVGIVVFIVFLVILFFIVRTINRRLAPKT